MQILRVTKLRCAAAGSVLSLAAGLCVLGPAPQAALAATPTPPAASSRAAALAAGNAHSCDLRDGRAYCWGENDDGQLGDGTTTDSSVPVAVDTSGALAGKTLTQISAGGGGGLDTCALDTAGAAYCWGSGFDGALGDGTTADSSVPVAVDTSGALHGKTITQVSTGSSGGCVLDAAGAAYCWGDNDYGELGDGSSASSDVPVAVDTSGVLAGQKLTQISAGFQDTCALDAAGAAYCWGDNAFWELGNGSGGSDGDISDVPVAVDASGALAGQGLTQISAGWEYACALDAAGAAYCWGSGPLGNSAGASSVPVAVDVSGALHGKRLAQVSAGFGATCSLDSAGAAYCWGDNGQGELGDGSTVSSDVPVAVDTSGALHGKTLNEITAGAFHSCAQDTADASYCWGDNTSGDLGDGSTSMSDVPVLVAAAAGPIVSGYRKAKCIDDSKGSAANDTPVVIGDCNGSAEQNWTVPGDGTIQIGGKCLDIYRDEKVSKAPVELFTCTGGANQQWAASNGTLVNPVSGKCLDDPRFNVTDGTQLEIYTCNGGANQQWQLP